MPACPSSPVSPVVAHLASAAEAGELVGTGLLAVLATVPDPRKPRGVRHQITTILALGACAVLSGARSFTAIGEWAANASDQVLAALSASCVPCESTIRRVLGCLDGDQLDTAIGAWAAASSEPPPGTRRAVAIDGKTVRGSTSDADKARHLLAAIDHGC